MQKKLRTDPVFSMNFDVMITLPSPAHHIQDATWAADCLLDCLTWGGRQAQDKLQ